MSVAFDKLAFIRRLEGVSIPRNQAEALSEAFHDAVAEAIATKADVTASATELRSEINLFRLEVKSEFAAVRAEMKSESAAIRAEFAAIAPGIKVWVLQTIAGAVVAIIGAMFAMFRFMLP